MKNKVFNVLGVALVTVLALSGCGTGDGGNSNGEIFDETKEWTVYEKTHLVDIPVEISFWSANSAVDLHGKAIAELVDEFNAYQKKTYPTSFIKVNASFQGGYGVQNTKFNNPKFRIWRGDIPRDGDTTTNKKLKADRMRNPWIHLKLSKNNPTGEKMIFHNLNIIYYN